MHASFYLRFGRLAAGLAVGFAAGLLAGDLDLEGTTDLPV